jgi:exodeoxyribonuclease-3
VPKPLRIASVNTNGIRAAYRKGMGEWLDSRGIDILAIQEVRAETDDVVGLLGDGWHVIHDAATAKGRAGVALASRDDSGPRAPEIHRVTFGSDDFDSAGRWLEADYKVGDQIITVVSTYVHSGEVDTPKQVEKFKFLDAMTQRLPELAKHSDLAVVMGDLNVGTSPLDIKNWRGNQKTAGFLPQERAYFARFFGAEGEPIEGPDGSVAPGLGWVDVGRRWAGEVDGPYTWWSNRGQAFVNDVGWRIDYHVATPGLAAAVVDYKVDRYPSYEERWSDHAPVVVDYAI